MIGFIKKFINSDFTKPLNTLIDEVKATLALIKAKTDTITADLFTSTHASRIDATISSRQASWGATTTHSSRLDASISSRASQASVDAIKSGRPVFGKVRIFTYAVPSTMPLTTVFSHSGGAGKFLFYRNMNGAISFIIDGVAVANAPGSFKYGVPDTSGVVVNLEFNQSIQIQVSTSSNPAATMEGMVITEN